MTGLLSGLCAQNESTRNNITFLLVSILFEKIDDLKLFVFE
jgi:hypothetical protein